MRKMICIMFAMIVAIMSSACMAEEIRFRDFEWEIGIDAIGSRIEELGYSFFDSNNNMPYWGTPSQQLDFMYDDATGEVTGWLGYGIGGDYGVLVGGYVAREVCFYCMYGISEDGDVIRDKQHSKLYRAEYVIAPADTNQAYEDLKAKLSLLYGECQEVSDESYGGEAIERITEWQGGNNTAVRLYGQMKNNPVKTESFLEYIKIIYSKTDADERLKAVEAAIERERLAAESALYGNSDVSGL